MWTIKLTYFKPSGKYYSEGEYKTDNAHVFQVIDEVKRMHTAGNLPGLGQGCGQGFFVHVNADEHPLGYPALLHPVTA